MDDNSKKIYGLIGRTLGHSYSPAIHTMLGCADYRLYELEPDKLGDFLSRGGIGGLNVTIPYKRDVMPFCAELSDAAREIGSVNTIVTRCGRLYGDNTDVCGFMYMAERVGITFGGKKVLVLGSGGASLTAQYAARRGGAAEVVVISRSGKDNYGNLDRHSDADIIINATPVGMYPDTDASPVDLTLFPECAGVLDMVYNPCRTRLLMQSERLGIPHSGGLPMLAAQAKAAEELFFDKRFDDSVIEDIIARIACMSVNIVLVGMPGCGKTTIGKRLAALSGREAVDTDALIEREAGMSIPDIFALKGEAAFRDLECRVIADVGRRSGLIIATGGGAVTRRENYHALRCNGRIYHIYRDIALLERSGRPLSQVGKLEHMYIERLPLYQSFSSLLINNNVEPETAAETIWRDFCANSCD